MHRLRTPRDAGFSLVELLVDGVLRRREWEIAGRTSGNSVVNFPGDESLRGQVVPVTITGHGPNSLRGTLAGERC